MSEEQATTTGTTADTNKPGVFVVAGSSRWANVVILDMIRRRGLDRRTRELLETIDLDLLEAAMKVDQRYKDDLCPDCKMREADGETLSDAITLAVEELRDRNKHDDDEDDEDLTDTPPRTGASA